MNSMTNVIRDDVTMNDNYSVNTCTTAVAWGAIIAGAFTAIAVSLALLILGSALGLSTLSPWSRPESITSFTVKTAIWLIVMQWIASGLGGYLTGRLRSKWLSMHNDEVFFRDTAHGFLAWAVATVVTATLLASAAASIVGGGVQAAATVASGSAAGASHAAVQQADNGNGVDSYYIDNLFRSATVNPAADTREVRAESTSILTMGLKNGSLPDADRTYLAQQIAARTGISEDEAAQRVDATVTQINTVQEKVKQDAEEARKTAMRVSVFIFLSLLVGAFIASSTAALGGKHRDEF
jgi:hypothetical protein